MSKNETEANIPHQQIERAYHSPVRTAIMAAVCAAARDGITFNELKATCNLTDGNLSAHLAALHEHGAVRFTKEAAGPKSKTTVFATKAGTDGFAAYLDTLQQVLLTAKAALAPQPAPAARRATA